MPYATVTAPGFRGSDADDVSCAEGGVGIGDVVCFLAGVVFAEEGIVDLFCGADFDGLLHEAGGDDGAA